MSFSLNFNNLNFSLKELLDKKVFTNSRFEYLQSKKWHKYNLIIHEAGINEFRTNIDLFENLPESVIIIKYIIFIIFY